MDADYSQDRITAEEPEGFTQVPDSLLLNTAVSDGAYRLYAVLKHHARQASSAFPRRTVLARELGVRSVRTVDARIKELKRFGYLKVRPRYHSLGGQTSNDYHLLFYPQPPVDGPSGVDGSETPEGAQDSAPRGGLRPRGADRRAPGARPAAPQRSTSPPSTPPPTSDPGRPPTRPGRRDETGGGGAGDNGTTPGPAERVDETAGPDAHPAGEPAAGPAAATGGGAVFAGAVLERLPAELAPRTRGQWQQMSQALEPYAGSWDPADLAHRLTAVRPLPEVVTHPVGLLTNRLEQLPPPRSHPRAARLPWCGDCDERTRMVYDHDHDVARRCPACHPRANRNRP